MQISSRSTKSFKTTTRFENFSIAVKTRLIVRKRRRASVATEQILYPAKGVRDNEIFACSSKFRIYTRNATSDTLVRVSSFNLSSKTQKIFSNFSTKPGANLPQIKGLNWKQCILARGLLTSSGDIASRLNPVTALCCPSSRRSANSLFASGVR